MEELGFGLDLIIVLAVAIAGGYLAHRVKLPTILGYLLGGIIIGPYGFGLVQDIETVHILANLGVILLMFTLGLEFSLKEIFKLGKIAILGGIAQILLTAAVGFGLGQFLHYDLMASVFLGFLLALSSTVVVLKSLIDRGELDSSHGRIMIGILLVQDISVVPLMTIIPALGGNASEIWSSLGFALLKAVGFTAIMLGLGYWILPWIFRRIASTRSRELFLLSVVTLVLAAAFGTYFFGLSAAFGAFAAGLLISQSIFARQAFADIVPLRDAFVALFFISLGMLVSPGFILEHIVEILIIAAITIVAKFIICAAIPLIAGHTPKTAMFTGAGMIQIGEFSFVLAGMALEASIISNQLHSLVLASAVITILLTPFSFSSISVLYRKMSQREPFSRLFARRCEIEGDGSKIELSGHAVICGYGTIGANLAHIMELRSFPYLVIDLDPQVIAQLHERSVPCIYGDAGNPEILNKAQLQKAKTLICTFPDFLAVELTARNARSINPKLDIIARIPMERNAAILKEAGIAEMVQPDFEASLEIIRHTLHRFGLSTVEIQYILNGLREDRIQ